MNLGEKLIKLRKDKNLSQEEVAEKLGVTRQTISKWETNESTPDLNKIVPICNLYDITTEELLTDKIIVKKENNKVKNQSLKLIDSIISTIALLLYLSISFLTKRWDITWIIWIIYVVVLEIIKLVFTLRGIDYEE